MRRTRQGWRTDGLTSAGGEWPYGAAVRAFEVLRAEMLPVVSASNDYRGPREACKYEHLVARRR